MSVTFTLALLPMEMIRQFVRPESTSQKKKSIRPITSRVVCLKSAKINVFLSVSITFLISACSKKIENV